MMGGLFGTSMDDPRTMGLFQLAAGLMSAPRMGQGLSQGLLAYGDTMSRAKQQQSLDELRKMQMEQQRMQMEQQRAQAEQQAKDRSLMQQQFAPMTGPTQDQGPLMPRFDPRALLGQGASPEAAMTALNLHTAMTPKPPKRNFEKVGDTLLEIPEQGAPQSVFTAAQRPPEAPASVREYEYAVKQGYKGTYQQFETAMKRAGASNMSVTYGAPVAGVGPDGKPVFFQPSKDGGPPSIVPGVAPPLPQLPASTKEKIAENTAALSKIRTTLDQVKKKPGALGAQNYLPDAINQRLDPGGVEVRAGIADIGSQKIHDRSGAAVTISEAPRLMPFIPQVTDTPKTVQTKLERLEKEYAAMIQALNSGATIQQAASASAPSGDGWSIKPVK
jgi:hypothetical protein